MIGFTSNPQTVEETHRQQIIALTSSMYNEYFNSEIIRNIDEVTISETGASAKFTLHFDSFGSMQLAFAVVFGSGFVSNKVQQDREKAESALADYVHKNVEEIKQQISSLVSDLNAINTSSNSNAKPVLGF